MLNYQRVIAGSSLLALSPHKYHLIAFDSWKASKCHFPHLGSWNIIEHQSNAKKKCRNMQKFKLQSWNCGKFICFICDSSTFFGGGFKATCTKKHWLLARTCCGVSSPIALKCPGRLSRQGARQTDEGIKVAPRTVNCKVWFYRRWYPPSYKLVYRPPGLGISIINPKYYIL